MCYNFGDEKKRCCIIININVKLFRGNEVLINENYNALYKEKEFLEYNDGNAVTHIDFINNIFSRKNEEFQFTIDFVKKTNNYQLFEQNINFTNMDESSSIEFKNNIIIKYEFDGNMKIIIKFL